MSLLVMMKKIDDVGLENHPYFKTEITIGNNVIICENSLIMPSVTISNRVIVCGGCSYFRYFD